MIFYKYNFNKSPYANVKDELLFRNYISTDAQQLRNIDKFKDYALDSSNDRYAVSNGSGLVAGIDVAKFIHDNGYNGVTDCIFPGLKFFAESTDEDANDVISNFSDMFDDPGDYMATIHFATSLVELFVTDFILAGVYTIIKLDINYLKDWLKSAAKAIKGVITKLLC